jgi:hypothetical protein
MRRRIWLQEKLLHDKDYRENAALARQKRADRNPDYWKEYRRTHPEYTERNLQQQRVRDEERRGTTEKKGTKCGKRPVLANETPSEETSPAESATCTSTNAEDDAHENETPPRAIQSLKSGTYEIRAADGDELAKGDAIRVEIHVLSKT